jgi:uncharacterized membrane protein YebE (DUF533 family)
MDAKRLLEQMLGGDVGEGMESVGRQMKARLDEAGGARSFAGGALTGGLLGLLLAGKRNRRKRGLGFGGAAVLGALAMQAYRTYQASQAGGHAPLRNDERPSSRTLPHSLPSKDGSPFELVLVRAMIGAAKADGHIDATEQRHLFAEVERMNLDAESKGFVFDLLTHDIDPATLARAVATQEQAAELYLAARLAIDPDQPAERTYLDTLASDLRLPADLRTRLDQTG